MTKEAIERFVRRGRSRLDAMRCLRGAARGALAGGVLGLVALIADRLGLAMPGWLPWSLCGAGAAAGLVVAALSPRIRLASAALFLDDRLETQERLVTVVTRETGRFAPRLLAELEGIGRLPRISLPREVSLVPAALFLLFAVGLLPNATGESDDTERGVMPPVATTTQAAAAQDPEEIRAAADRLARGQAPKPSDADTLRRAVEEAVFSPEQRRAALDALKRAAGGDGSAAKRVGKILEAAQGGAASDDADNASDVTPAPAAGDRSGGAAVTAYTEHRELVLAYRRALAEEKNR